jgi:hypothetical protein
MTEMPKTASVRRLITTHPFTVGGLLGTIMVCAIFVIVVWFPRIGDAWDRHDKMVRSIWCTLALFVVCVYHLWRWRHRRGFWVTLSAFFVLHVVGVLLYSIYVHPLLLQEWIILLLLEAFVIAFFFDWVLQRLSQSRHRHC